MRTIAVLNQKGGVGKTTSVVNIAAALANMGKKVIAIDMDPQAHLTIHLGINPETAGAGVYDVLTKSADLTESLVEVRDNLFLLGANINLVGAESELVSVVGREIILREAIESIKGQFDYLIIDCAPSLGLLTLNGLAAVSEVFIPLQPHFLALQGLGKLLQTVTLVSKRINPDLKVTGILLCMYNKRATLSGEVKADIQNFLNNARNTDCPWATANIIPVHIRRNIKLAEAPSYGQTIFEYEPECNGSYDYTQVAKYVENDMGEKSFSIAEPVAIQQDVEEVAEVAEETIQEPAPSTDTPQMADTGNQAETFEIETIEPAQEALAVKTQDANEQEPQIDQQVSAVEIEQTTETIQVDEKPVEEIASNEPPAQQSSGSFPITEIPPLKRIDAEPEKQVVIKPFKVENSSPQKDENSLQQ